MFIHWSVEDGGNIGPSIHLAHKDDGLTKIGVSWCIFNDEISIGFALALFYRPLRVYVALRWVKTERRFKHSLDFRFEHRIRPIKD